MAAATTVVQHSTTAATAATAAAGWGYAMVSSIRVDLFEWILAAGCEALCGVSEVRDRNKIFGRTQKR